MKNILTLIIGLLLIVSCKEVTLENSVEYPEEFTTIALQKLPKDTIVVAFDEFSIYHFNSDGLITLQAKVVNSDTGSIKPTGKTVIFIIFIFLFGIVLGIALNHVS